MSDRLEQKSVFKLDPPQRGPLRRTLFSLVRRPLEKLLCLDRLGDYYCQAAESDDGRDVFSRVLDAMNITYEISAQDRARIPRQGPLMVVANHPFGAVDGMILVSMLRSVRPDVKLLTNYLLAPASECRKDCIYVDPFGRKSSVRANVHAMREALQWVKGGGALAMFPSGEVSHISWRKPAVTDPAWSDTVARIVRTANAPALPVFFRGVNSALFQLMGLAHPRFRTIMLPRELLKRCDTTVRLHVGKPVTRSQIANFDDDKKLMAYLRLRTYILGRRESETPVSRRKQRRARRSDVKQAAVVAAEDPSLVKAEIEALPPEALLVESGEFAVYLAWAEQIPHVLREIGRLREITFREVGEGTGKELDLDRFDEYYGHLFVWQRKKEEIVGAYRIGLSDEILAQHGKKGLYTSTLFKLSKKLLRQIDPALELGRSFVRKEYQRHTAPLNLLWRGLARFVLLHPRYHVLFGPVSISNDYTSTSRQLIVQFLRQNEYLPKLGRLVKPKSRVRRKRIHGISRRALRDAASISELSALVSDLEADDKGVPILIRHYLRLSGKLLGFNLDTEFGDVVDGLILVDLTETDQRILARYMGREEAAEFLACPADSR